MLSETGFGIIICKTGSVSAEWDLNIHNLNYRKTLHMISTIENSQSNEKENRRTGIDRREFSYTHYLPERRGGKDRRRDKDENSASEKKK